MGWSGYNLYSGDGTQTCHIDFLINAGVFKNYDDYFEYEEENDIAVLLLNRTKLTKEQQKVLSKNVKKVLKKMPKLYRGEFRDEDDAVEWQMLLSLFVDNHMKAPKEIYEMGVRATNYLMCLHASEFDDPSRRRQKLRAFIKRAEKWNKK